MVRDLVCLFFVVALFVGMMWFFVHLDWGSLIPNTPTTTSTVFHQTGTTLLLRFLEGDEILPSPWWPLGGQPGGS